MILQRINIGKESHAQVKNSGGGPIGPPPYVYEVYGLTFDGCDAGEHLAFDSLKKSATTGGNIGHLVGEAELVDTSHGVTTANERESTIVGGFYDSIGNSA